MRSWKLRGASRPNRRARSSWRTRSPASQAGRAGRFGCVIGVDHSGQSQALREAGADVVVTSLAQVKIAVEPPSAWSLVYEGFDPAREGIREALCALGNGYFATRGAGAWAVADDVHYPGTYLACGYNRLRTDIAGRVVENEDLVNFPNWLALEFRIADEDWFDARTVTILSYRQELDLRRGMLLRTITLRGRPGAAHDAQGAPPGLDERHAPGRAGAGADRRELVRDASRSVRPSMGASSTRARSSIANSTTNTWSRWQARSLARTACICWCAPASRIFMSRRRRERERSSTDSFARAPRRVIDEPGYIGQELVIDLQQGETLVLEKLASFYTSRDQAISECGLAARKAIARAGRFDAVMAEHVLAWKHLWRRFDVHMQPAESGIQAERPDAAAVEHVSPAAGGVAQLHRARYRRAGARLDRGSLPGPHLLG